MAKEKLFTPEDFDKPKTKKNKLLKTIYLVFGILCIIGVCVWLFVPKTTNSDKIIDPEQTIEQPIPNDPADLMLIDLSDSIPKVNCEEKENPTNEQTNKVELASKQSTQNNVTVADSISTVSILDKAISNNVEAEALKVIRGIYGNIPERKERLGSHYPIIQARVNEMKREGLF